MTYAAMAQDLRDTLDANNIQKATLIGHSMGGKAVMALTALALSEFPVWWSLTLRPSITTFAVTMRFSLRSML